MNGARTTNNSFVFNGVDVTNLGNTLTFTKGKHSIRAGGEMRRHHLDGDLQESRDRRHNVRSWFDFLTVGYRDPAQGNRARQFTDTAIAYGESPFV